MKIWLLVLAPLLFGGQAMAKEPLRINQIQFIGSHNSYKQAMSPENAQALAERNPAAAQSLEYAHLPLAAQLDLGMRKLELDVFYTPETDGFVVGHVQAIDMNSHCTTLRICLRQITDWSNANQQHVPLWISFNTKDQVIAELPIPTRFDAAAFELLDSIVQEAVGDKLIWPKSIRPEGSHKPQWPALPDARGKMLFILDEGGEKRAHYAKTWADRPLFVTVGINHPASAILVINDPQQAFEQIKSQVQAGFMVRTRADADTKEARNGDLSRFEAAQLSGAQAISTDYYMPATHFGTDYQVRLPNVVRCNPVTAPSECAVTE
ncbi:MAG: hypothetical protein ACI9ON_000831 [Limisphaerales bacterium]|jgi:hypothetical protein